MVVPVFDSDFSFGVAAFAPGGGTDAPGVRSGPVPAVEVSRGEIDGAFARLMWLVSRPAWTQAGWWDADVRGEVRGLMLLPVGRELHRRLAELAMIDRSAGYPRGRCPQVHTSVSKDEILGVPGSPCACQVVTAAAWTAVASWVAAKADEFVVDVAGDQPLEDLLVPGRPELGVMVDPCIEELAPALRVSPGSARHRLEGMRRVAGIPGLRAAVAKGLVVGWHAHLLATDLRHLPEAERATVVATLLDRLRQRRAAGLREWTLTDLRSQAKRIAAGLDLDLAARRKQCHRDRGVRLRLHGQGSATISADLTDDVATRLFRRLTAIAHVLGPGTDGDEGPRTLDQRRADVFTDLLLAPPTPPHGPEPSDRMATSDGTEPIEGPIERRIERTATADPPHAGGLSGGASLHRGGDQQPPGHAPDGGHPPGGDGQGSANRVLGAEVAVVIDLATLLRLAENPGEVLGCGPVAADVARELAADTRWRAWITTTTTAGTQVIATSPGTYRPTAALSRLIRAREPYCRMPGCRSSLTDLDHVTPFPGGPTTEENLGPLCRRHHRLKTHTRWRQQAPIDHADSDSGGPGCGPPQVPVPTTRPSGTGPDPGPARETSPTLDSGPHSSPDVGYGPNPHPNPNAGSGPDSSADVTPEIASNPNPTAGPHPGAAPVGWIWTTPSGISYRDEPESPLP